MAQKSANSLKGKIWLATSVLAFFICTFGLISYLVVSLLINDAFYGVFIPFLFLGFAVMVFGWWLSNEVVSPIEKVTLLAKSLERGASTSLPKSTGSAETDQLLQTLHRNGQQMQKLVLLMDKVANGNVDVALTPLQGSDRLTASFQKLLAKFSESIHAKEDLKKLQDAVGQIKREISTVRNGNLDVEIKTDFFQTKEITETFKYLIEHMNQLIKRLKQDSQIAQGATDEVDKTINTVIQQDENQIHEMNQASIVLKQVPNLIKKISEDLSGSAKSAKQSIDKAKQGNRIAHQNSNAVSQLRKQMRDAARGIQSLNERSQEIAKVAKTVEDLAHRTNMIALNASIQATEIGENGHGFVLVAEEVEKLATRANGTNKQISTLNKSILSEINKVGTSLETTTAEVANLSRFAIETANILGELERYVGQFLNLQENLIAYSKQQSEETDEAFQTFVKSISETETSVGNLKDSSIRIENLGGVMKNLQMLVTEYRLVQEEDGNQFGSFSEDTGQTDDSLFEANREENEDSLYEEFAKQEFELPDLNRDDENDLFPADDDHIDPYASAADDQIDPYASAVEDSLDPYASAVEDSFDPYASAVEDSFDPYASAADDGLDHHPAGNFEKPVRKASFSDLDKKEEALLELAQEEIGRLESENYGSSVSAAGPVSGSADDPDALELDADEFYPSGPAVEEKIFPDGYRAAGSGSFDPEDDSLSAATAVDDSQIEEIKISYDTAELPPEIDPNSPIPTYEEI
jgi:methyl-accepting chemotaxis protein